jgi:hypothetical protein
VKLAAAIIITLLVLALIWAGTDGRNTIPFYDSPLEDS